MKKTIIYILLALTFASTFSITTLGITASAETNLIAVTAPTIPKPDLLPGPSPERIEGKEGGGTGRDILTKTILPFFAVGLIGFVGGLSLVFLVIAGVRFATAYGNEEAVEKAKNQAMYALIGFIIALLSYTIVTIIINLRIGGDTTIREQPQQEPQTESTTEEKT